MTVLPLHYFFSFSFYHNCSTLSRPFSDRKVACSRNKVQLRIKKLAGFEDHFSKFYHFSIFPRTFRIRGRIISKRQLCGVALSRLAHFSHDITGSNVCQRPSQATDESSRILKNAIKPPKQCAIEKTLRRRFYLWRKGTVYFENSNSWHKLPVFHLPFYLPFARIYLPLWEKTCFSQNTPGNEKRLNYELFS